MQLRDPVGALAEAEAHHGHVELARVAALVVLRAEREYPVQRHVAEAAELVDHQLAREPVDPGRHRGVGGEHRARPAALQGAVEVQAGVQVLPDPLQPEEAGVALVEVEDLRGRGAADPAVRPDGPDAADAQQHLLGQPVVGAAAVEPVGHLPLVAGVVLHVGVEQQQRDPADLGQPDLGVQGPPGQRHLDAHRGAVRAVQQGQRQRVRVEQRIALLLPAGQVERLAEVAGPVEQADADDRDAQVAGRLEVVTGQDAQPAGVLRQHLGDAELRGEVADRLGRGRLLGGVALVPEVAGEVLLQIGGDHPQALGELLVRGQHLQPLDGDVGQQPDRVALGGVPDLGVDRPEQVLGVGVPAPAQVAGQLAQRLQHLGQDRADGEPSDCTHPPNLVVAPGGVQACRPTGLGLRGSTGPVARPIGLAP